MVTSIKGGVQLNLGAVSNEGLQSQVKASDVMALLKGLDGNQAFKLAQGRLEFRLLSRNGEALFQLKERTASSKFLSFFGIGSSTRAEQRQLAMDAINRRFGLGQKPQDDEVTGDQSRTFAAIQGHRVNQLYQAKEAGALRLGISDKRTLQQVTDTLGLVQSSAADGEVKDNSEPLAPLFDKKVFGTLSRAAVSVSSDGVLHIGGQRQGGSVGDNLETVVKFMEEKSGFARTDPQFKPLLRHITRNDHFVFAAKVNDHFSQAAQDKFGVSAMSLNILGRNQISFENGVFSIRQSCSGDINVGGVEFNPNGFSSGLPIKVTQSFDLNIQDLVQDTFDITKAVQNLQFKEIF